jgi:hypothetical protein
MPRRKGMKRASETQPYSSSPVPTLNVVRKRKQPALSMW